MVQRVVMTIIISAAIAASGALLTARSQAPASKPVSIPPPADVAAPPADGTKIASGLVFRVLQPGTGTRHAESSDMVTVHYTGWTTDGKMFDSSVARGKPNALELAPSRASAKAFS